MYFVYILVCLDTGRCYVGQTDNLIRRYHWHLAGLTRTTRQKLRKPVVIYWELLPTRSAALRRERYFKAGSGHRLKHQIIAQRMPLFAAHD